MQRDGYKIYRAIAQIKRFENGWREINSLHYIETRFAESGKVKA